MNLQTATFVLVGVYLAVLIAYMAWVVMMDRERMRRMASYAEDLRAFQARLNG